MKIEITFQIKNLRMLKGVFQTLHKVLFEDKRPVNIFLVYFATSKQIRFLIDSQNCKTILALDPAISINDKSTVKEGSELLTIQFMDPQPFLKNICEIVDKEGSGDVTITLSKDKIVANEEAFRSLNFSNSSHKYRNEIFRPQYDPPKIVNHLWLNGCHSNQQKKVEFDVQSEQLLCLLRILFRHKQTQSKEKMILLQLNFVEGKLIGSLEKLHHKTCGDIYDVQFKHQKFKGNYYFSIPPHYADKLYQLFMAKSSGRRFIINIQNNLIFHYYHTGVFESQVIINEWVRFERFDPVERATGRMNETKIETF